jgi:hypothetical protein
MRAWLTSGVGVLAATWCLGCGGAAPKPAGEALGVERLYPLRPGSVWTYDVDTGEGVPTLAITRVMSRKGEQVEVSNGSDAIVYEVRPDGLYRQDLDSYVLKTPVVPGTRWETRDGASAEITGVAQRVNGPAGDFQGCVEVRESGGANQKQVRTVFCPDVGPVEIESSLQMAVSGQVARVLAKLRGYDFSGALQAAGTAAP